jgi:hypothetical protein
MGYRARVEPPTPAAYTSIFKYQASKRGIVVEQPVLDHILAKYRTERRQMKGCEPRDILDRATDICKFENQSLKLTPTIVDIAWCNYFGTSHSFVKQEQATANNRASADPLEL